MAYVPKSTFSERDTPESRSRKENREFQRIARSKQKTQLAASVTVSGFASSSGSTPATVNDDELTLIFMGL